MKTPLRILCVLISGSFLPLQTSAHESFLLWHNHHLHLHEHSPHSHGHEYGHDHEHHEHDHLQGDGKSGHKLELQVDEEHRWAFGTGVRYTRLSWEDEAAHLWESGVGMSYRVNEWLNLGAEVTYGWFDSVEGRSSGVMFPHFFADVHLPIAERWEAIVSLGTATPGGDEGLVGNHWEVSPGIALRYDTGRWFVEAGANLFFLYGYHDHAHGSGDDEQHEDHEEEAHEEHHDEAGHEDDHGHEHEHEEETHHAHSDTEGHGHAPGDYHEVVDPHGKREVDYYLSLGVRLLDERLTLEGRFHGVHVISGDTPSRDYLRVGARAVYQVNENWAIRTEASVPITDARRNQWQTSLSVQVSF